MDSTERACCGGERWERGDFTAQAFDYELIYDTAPGMVRPLLQPSLLQPSKAPSVHSYWGRYSFPWDHVMLYRHSSL